MLYGRTARGSVVSLSTGRPLAGVAISSVQGTATTNAEGRFELSGLRIGTHPVTVTAAGFAPFDATVRVGALGGAESQIAVPDAKLTVRIDEVAVDLKAADGVKVTVGGLTASRVGTGTYEITGAKPGRVTVAASGASYEPTKTTLALKPGANSVTLRVRLNPWETYSRYFQAYKSGRWAVAYAYLHPDVAKRESLATYTADMKAWGVPVSTSLQSANRLPSWTSPKTGVTYRDVVELHRTLVTNKGAMRYVTALPQHWANVGGVWMRVDL
jgi:hypothetical protein